MRDKDFARLAALEGDQASTAGVRRVVERPGLFADTSKGEASHLPSLPDFGQCTKGREAGNRAALSSERSFYFTSQVRVPVSLLAALPVQISKPAKTSVRYQEFEKA